MSLLNPKILNAQYFFQEQSGIPITRTVMDYEIDLHVGGKREMIIDGKTYYTEKDCVAFRVPGQTVCSNGENFNCYILSLDFSNEQLSSEYSRNSASIQQKKCTSDLLTLIPSVFTPKHIDDIKKLFTAIIFEYTNSGNSITTEKMILQLILLIASDSQNTMIKKELVSANMQELCMYIVANHQKDITLDSLADMANLNKNYLVRRFRREIGMSPIDYLIKTRLDHAQDMLKNTDIPVKFIAYKCGYRNATFFTNTFKKHFGVTPSAYRTEFLKSQKENIT